MKYSFNVFTGNLDLVGTAATAPVISTIDKISVSLKNNTGSSLSILTPVIVNSSGEADNIDVSTITEKRQIGVCNETISNGSFGDVVVRGQMTDVTTVIAVGSVVYVDKSGALSSSIPTVGVGGFVAGDAMIKIGTLSINETNPANKDLLVDIEIITLI